MTSVTYLSNGILAESGRILYFHWCLCRWRELFNCLVLWSSMENFSIGGRLFPFICPIRSTFIYNWTFNQDERGENGSRSTADAGAATTTLVRFNALQPANAISKPWASAGNEWYAEDVRGYSKRRWGQRRGQWPFHLLSARFCLNNCPIYEFVCSLSFFIQNDLNGTSYRLRNTSSSLSLVTWTNERPKKKNPQV